MSVPLILGVFISLMRTCDANLKDTSLNMAGLQTSTRRIRSLPATTLFLQGLRATRKILEGARKIHSRDRFGKYEKIGNKYTAAQDFYSLQPREVKRVELQKGVNIVSGVIGDRQIFLIDANVNPIIQIIDNNAKKILEKWKQPGKYGEIIIYKQKVSDKKF